MEQTHSVVLGGIGGSGVVWAGTLLARAGLKKYPYVSRFPNFTTNMRGGPCECMVIFSYQEIPCPLVEKGDALVIFENTQTKLFEGRVRPGGLVILESSGPFKVDRDDVRVIYVPALKIASSLGELLVTNTILLGVYIQKTKVFPPEYIQREIEARFGITETGIRAVERHPLLQLNLEAFKRGLEFEGA